MPDVSAPPPQPAVKDERSHFLAHMGHDLRAPMTNILALTEALVDGVYGPMPETQVDTLKHIRENGHRMINMITDLVDLARIDTGQTKLEPTSGEIMEPCRAGIEMANGIAKSKRITVTTECVPPLATAMADVRRLRQLASSLATAAVVSSPASGQVVLRMEARAEQGRFCLTALITRHPVQFALPDETVVAANATPEALVRLRKMSAVAVSVVDKLAALHGGTFHVAERDGAIAMAVGLPMTFAQAAAVPPATTDGAAAPSAAAPMHILLADDEDIIRTITRDYLESTGYRVSCATNGAEALDILQKDKPDLVILDMQMPVLDGMDALKRMRSSADPQIARIPVISLSGLVTPGHRDLCVAAGANGCLAKPFGIKELERAIKELIGNYQH
jgi:CheY-like chemotaxis protein